ncbi:transposase [Methylobacter sp.]|uniref:REP-associated tyrosine transposase n=1 Tax=Methylobacter sp. TaxID=2051955 RepID=UPI001202D499|nr:transposase [Methylobacter sp.]TAK61525.1 MAG: transposase [Methylobacter sp.]
MSNYRRCYVPGGSYFFTVVTERRAKILGNDLARDLLRAAFQDCFQRWPPFRVDAAYPKRWGAIKKHFTQSWISLGGAEKTARHPVSLIIGEGVWQRYYAEHALRDERDYQRHFDYIHYNPVKHGLVKSPRDWPYSTFHRWVKRGVYNSDWGCSLEEPLDFSDIISIANE